MWKGPCIYTKYISFSVYVDVNEIKESGDNQSSFQASWCTIYLKMMFKFIFFCNMTSDKLRNIIELVQ